MIRLPTRPLANYFISRLLAIILAASACAACDSPSSEEPPPRTGSQITGIEISADALHAGYIENRLVSDRRFRGQMVTVTGRVADIQMFGDRPMINLRASTNKGVVQCYFEPDQAAAVAKIAPGQQVRIKGRCDGFAEGAVLVKECVMK